MIETSVCKVSNCKVEDYVDKMRSSKNNTYSRISFGCGCQTCNRCQCNPTSNLLHNSHKWHTHV